MRLLDVQTGEGYVTATVVRWRWFRRVRETWVSDDHSHYCFHGFLPSADGGGHRDWFRDPDGAACGCWFAVRLDRAESRFSRFNQLRAKQDAALDRVIQLDERRRKA